MSVPKPFLESRAAGLIGGVVSSLNGPPDTEALRAAMACMPPGAGTMLSGEEPIGLFASGRATLERSEKVWVAADLDLLNLDELRTLTGLDPERPGLIGRLYELEGPGFVHRLRGAFAVALWDPRQRHLLLAVDHFGTRRLYYTTDSRETAFASRLAAIPALDGHTRQIDPAAIYSYLNFGFVPAHETPFAGTRRLPPGHVLSVRPGHIKLEPYWDMSYPEAYQPEARAAASLYRLSHQAVHEALGHLPLHETGAFLSGGTDSSAVVGLISRITGERINTVSIGFHEDHYDELAYAALTARHFGATHHTRIVTADDALNALPALVEAYDEPFGNNSAIGTLFCARTARDHGITHLLAGDGGDEIFGGNERYRTDRIFARYGRVPAGLRRGLLEPFLLGWTDSLPGILGRAQRYIRRAKTPNPRRFYSYEFHVAQSASQMLEPDFLRHAAVDGPWQLLERYFGLVKATSELNRLLYLDLKLTIGDNDLFKVTRTAELGGVTVRFPFLALPLVEFMATLPVSFKVRGLEKRYLFKRAFHGLLPPETLAKRKHGFGVPTSMWLKTHPGTRDLARDTLLAARAVQRGYFRRGVVEDLFERHSADTTPFYGDILWNLLMLELWHRRHADRGGVAA